MDMRDIINLIEDAPTTGMLPAQDLAKLLPGIVNQQFFASALMKIENGQDDTLTLQEKTELSNAFISIIKMPDTQKTVVIQKMMPVSQPQQKPEVPQQPQQQRPLQG